MEGIAQRVSEPAVVCAPGPRAPVHTDGELMACCGSQNPVTAETMGLRGYLLTPLAVRHQDFAQE
jgi:hypothetical protein